MEFKKERKNFEKLCFKLSTTILLMKLYHDMILIEAFSNIKSFKISLRTFMILHKSNEILILLGRYS